MEDWKQNLGCLYFWGRRKKLKNFAFFKYSMVNLYMYILYIYVYIHTYSRQQTY